VLLAPGSSDTVSDGDHGPVGLVENVIVLELEVTVKVLGIGSVIGAEPAVS
jgi:hypothetical protein